jgi:hypothetical protein
MFNYDKVKAFVLTKYPLENWRENGRCDNNWSCIHFITIDVWRIRYHVRSFQLGFISLFPDGFNRQELPSTARIHLSRDGGFLGHLIRLTDQTFFL